MSGTLSVSPTAERAGLRMYAGIVTPLPHVGFEIDPSQLPFVRRRFVRAGVRMSPGTTVTSGADGAVRVASVRAPDPAGGREAIDAVVVSDVRAADRALADELRVAVGDAVELGVIGDALAVRLLEDAVGEGARAGCAV